MALTQIFEESQSLTQKMIRQYQQQLKSKRMEVDIPNKHQYRIFKIVQEKPQHIVLTDGTNQMIFRRYHITFRSSLSALSKRHYLKHQALINIFKIQVESAPQQGSLEQPTINCGILTQKYQKTLAEAAREMSSFSQDEIFQTIRPIKDALDYLISQNFDPGQITLKTIVCNSQSQIKFLDGYLQETQLNITQRPRFQTLVYQQFANCIFYLLFSKERYIKSWKTRYQMAEKNLNTQNLRCLAQICQKFAPNILKCEKQKKIKKVQIKGQKYAEHRMEKKINTRLHVKKTNGSSQSLQISLCQQGKQNKIIQ